MAEPTTVADCMRRQPLTIGRDANLVEAIELIVEHKLTGLTVTDEKGCAVGILSELDCLQGVLTAVYNDGDPEHSLVSEVMTSDVVSCESSDSLIAVAEDMIKSRQRRRPVVEGGKLVGQVSSRNILWAIMEYSRRKRFDAEH